LRAVEEMLLKGATHNITVRARPEVALYVLNQKRAHLRSLEERFRIAITINADATINGQVAFAIDRGEQVMTAEQARALAAQAQAALARADAAEPAAVAETDFEAEPEDEDRIEAQPQSYESPLGMHEGAQREGGRRRRRRRRRGRGGAGREQAAFANEAAVNAGVEPPEWTAEAEGGEPEPQEQPQQQPQQVHGEAQGESQRRRRRRGRRGGRRNRRERESYGEIVRSEQVQPYPETAALADEAQFEAATPAPELREIAAEPERFDNAAPVPAPAAAAPPVQPAPAAPEPPRRRSTVREPAPAAGSPRAEIPQPVQVPSVTIAVESLGPHAQDGEETRPRRTGWWARRQAGDKG
jgi:ribonuclease E